MSANQYSIQTNFTAGEWSPKMRGRVDQEKYYNSVQTALNCIPEAQGGITKRPGSYFVSEAKDSSKPTRIIPFIFSTTQAYILEFGDLYMRVYRDRSQAVLSAKTITNITKANPAVVTSAGHSYSNGDQVNIDSVVGMTEVNNRRFTVANQATNTFELQGVDSTAYTTYSSGGFAREIYEIVTPWGEDDLEQLKFTQSADTLFVAHPDYAPRVITRSGDTTWTLSTFDFIDGPYLDLNTTATTLAPTSTTVGASVTLNASAPVFASTDIGRVVRIKHLGTWGSAKITAFTNTSVVTATVTKAFGDTTNSTDWRLGAWSSGPQGWPSVVTFFQERLAFAATSSKPQTIWSSETNDFTSFSPSEADGTVVDTNAWTFTISDDQVNAIRWMNAGKTLLQIGTSDAEHILYGGNSSGALVAVTPSNVSIGRESAYGSSPFVRAKRIANNVIFAQRSGKKIRASVYDYKYDSYVAKDITLKSEHITDSGVKDFDYQEEPIPTAWFCLNDGRLVGFTYEPDEDVMAWHGHEMGGDGAVEYIAVIPNPDARYGDDLWMVTNRTINGTQRRHIEYLESTFDPVNNGQSSGFFVDSGLTYDGYASGTVTPGATTGTGVTFTASDSVFTAQMVGRKIYQYDADNELLIVGRATITAYTSATQVTCTITDAFPAATAIGEGYWAVAIQTVSGANHLDGEAVAVCVDGATHPDVTPEFGVFTLNNYYSRVHIGFRYNMDVKMWPPEDTRYPTTQGLEKVIKEICVYFYQTSYCKFGNNFNNMEYILFRTANDIMNAPVPLFSGIKRYPFPGGISLEPNVCIRSDQPLPCTITFLESKVENYG